MLIFTDKELEYIKVCCESIFTLEATDEMSKDYLNSLGEDIKDKVRYVIDNISKINEDEEFNALTIDLLWWEVNGYWNWREGDLTGKEVKKYINDDNYCNLYDKILEYLDKEDEDSEED